MANLKKKSFIRPSQALVNFDYTDVSSRLGYVIFDGFTDSSGSAHLSGDAYHSKDLFLRSASLSGTNTEELASFVTSPFNYPAIIKGNIYFVFAMEVTPTGAGSGTANGIINIDFYHNTTLQFSLESQQINDGSAGDEPQNVVLAYDVTTPINVKIGDTLKVVATAKGKSGGYAALISMGCDPSDSGVSPIDKSVDTCSTSKFQVLIPFKIDI